MENLEKKTFMILMGEMFFSSEDIVHVLNHLRKSLLCSHKFVVNIKDMTPKILMVEPWICSYENFQFFKLSRMSKKTFIDLAEKIGRSDEKKILAKPYTGGHYPVSLYVYGHILIFLCYMATQDTLLSIGTRFKVSPTTVMSITNKVLYFMLKLKSAYIKFPENEAETRDISEGFKEYPGK
ncbi:unnamed protein product [Acanthoscelides obtectus]|uniref:Transposase Helix-turn-helix domain-containing protein n=1 Tax=Acanthoscelides obtectus TaxID=200917 RepID=A0A9P0KQQ6_ACAOB|nr:unnamed protein product [Acanthoscelides obtectus]CAK1641907.1 hypothetical protein AOBTE_LOCUS12714 [Acanthoscelides obtectus]